MSKTVKYITTAIDYVNSVPHIGTSYEKIGADVLARFARIQGFDVIFQMGNDEHSVNVQKSAREKGLDPKVYCDQMRPKFESAWKKLDISNTQFIQTSEPRHHIAVKKLFQKIFDNGDIYPRDYEGWYCESCEAFYTDKDLIEGACPNHKSKPRWLKEKNYFFKLSRYADFLLDYIERHPDFILPRKRCNEVVQFIKSGLEDVSVSRSSFDWGIPLPVAESHVVYVWFDALINYITGIGYGTESADFLNKWENVTHVIGKDITRFHCVIWPAMLKSADLPLPKQILGHGFVYLKGEKMSKSLGNVVTPLDIIEKYPEFGADALRYYLLRGSSFGDDGDFTWDGFIERYNADLANGYGNLVARTMGMVWRYQKGVVNPLPAGAAVERALLAEASIVIERVLDDLDAVKSGDVNFHFALERIWSFIARIDKYIDTAAPWTLAKNSESEKLSVVLTTILEAIRHITMMVYPFIPAAASKVWQALGFERIHSLQQIQVAEFTKTTVIQKPHTLGLEKLMLFPRIELEDTTTTQQPASKAVVDAASTGRDPSTNLIDIDTFFKSELKVAKILSAEKVEGADKLLKLQVEVGEERRQIVAGIAEFYAPEQLIGKSVVIVANLKPAKIRGIESQGMLLAAKKGKTLYVVTPDGEIASGAKVG